MLDQSRIGAILDGEPDALFGGPPVTAMLIQNTNPVSVAPEQNAVKRGFARDDLFVCVHEQFMTETAAMADIVLPATMFLEHDDIYQGGGSQYILLGPKLVDAPGECRANHEVIAGLAKRLGVEHRGLRHDAARIHRLDAAEIRLGRSRNAGARSAGSTASPPSRRAHYLDGFDWPDGKFRFKPDWPKVPFKSPWTAGPVGDDAGAARPLGGDRGCGRRASVPAGDLAGAPVPQLDLQRDADLAEAGRAPDADDPSR